MILEHILEYLSFLLFVSDANNKNTNRNKHQHAVIQDGSIYVSFELVVFA